jgi:chaperonin GroES
MIDFARLTPPTPDKPKRRILPMPGFVVVKLNDAEEATPGGVFLPETVRQSQEATVVALGGANNVNNLEVGDTVVFTKYAGSELKLDDVLYIVLRFDNIIAKLLPAPADEQS